MIRVSWQIGPASRPVHSAWRVKEAAAPCPQARESAKTRDKSGQLPPQQPAPPCWWVGDGLPPRGTQSRPSGPSVTLPKAGPLSPAEGDVLLPPAPYLPRQRMGLGPTLSGGSNHPPTRPCGTGHFQTASVPSLHNSGFALR